MSNEHVFGFGGDYLIDTIHLSCMEHGILLKLLLWRTETKLLLPKDIYRIASICNARSDEEIEALKIILRHYFVFRGEGYSSPTTEESKLISL